MTGRQPLIGLSAYCEEARWGYWQSPAVLLPANYAEQVTAAGPQAEPVHRGRVPVPLDEIVDLDGGRVSHAGECKGTSEPTRQRPAPR